MGNFMEHEIFFSPMTASFFWWEIVCAKMFFKVNHRACIVVRTCSIFSPCPCTNFFIAVFAVHGCNLPNVLHPLKNNNGLSLTVLSECQNFV